MESVFRYFKTDILQNISKIDTKGGRELVGVQLLNFTRKKMKNLPIIFLILTLASSVSMEMIREKENKISKLVFRHYMEVTEEGKKSNEMFLESIIDEIRNENLYDSARFEILDQYPILEVLNVIPETEIHIELNQDTIWRFTLEYGKMIGDLFRIDRKEGIKYHHGRIDKSKVYHQVNLFELGGDFSIEEYPDDRKELLGYNCFKIVIRKKNQDEEDFPMDLGDTLYEMYVTKEIDLPVHALLDITKNFSDFFPLEVKIWEENMKGNHEVYVIKEIN